MDKELKRFHDNSEHDHAANLKFSLLFPTTLLDYVLESFLLA